MAVIRTLYAGAAVRAPLAGLDPAWSDARRSTYLLRPDIDRPVSIDPNVWSVVELDRAGAELPWVSPDQLRAIAEERGAHGALVAFGIVTASTDDEVRAAARGVDRDLEPDRTWRLLGFDVADGRISGLSNCGYDVDELVALRVAWGSKLNAHGLFSDVVDATAFRDVTNARVREHAPFDVVALWLVGEL